MGTGLQIDSAQFNRFGGGDYPDVGSGYTYGGSPSYNITNNYNYASPKPPKAEPSWMALVGKGAQAGFKAASVRTEAMRNKNMLGFEAQLAANNAAIAGYQAQLDQQAGAAREQNSRLQTASAFGAQRARMAASGIDLGQGSATDVLASTEYMGERNAMMIRDDTNRQVWQDRVQQYRYQADQQYKQAQADAINPDMAGLASMASMLGSL